MNKSFLVIAVLSLLLPSPALRPAFADGENCPTKEQDHAAGQSDFGGDVRGIDGASGTDPFAAPKPADWEKDASAAMLDGDFKQNRAQVAQNTADSEQAKRDAKYKELDERVKKEEAERQARLYKVLQDERATAERQLKQFYDRAGQDPSKWSEDQQKEHAHLEERYNELNQPTAEENAESERHQQVREQVTNEIRQTAFNMGGLSQEDIQARQDAHDTSKAARQTWSNWTFTGRAASMVDEGIFRSREQGIFANNMIMGADIYLNKPGITQEQRDIAQGIKDRNMEARGAAATHIVQQGAVVIGGVAGDVATLGVGKVANKIAGFFGAEAGTQAGVEAGTQATAQATAKAGATEAGATAGAKVAGTEAGAATGAKVAGTEAGAQTGGKVAGTEAGQAAGQGVKPTTQQIAQQQAAHDANAAKQAGEAWRSGKNPNPGDSIVMPVESAAAQAELQAIKQSAGKLSQAEMNKLFEKGANLTREQIIQKAELLQQGYRATPGGVVPPAPVPPGVAPPGAGMGTSGASGATGSWAEGATQIGGEMGQAAKGAAGGSGQAVSGATQPFNQVLPTPGAGQAASGGTTQAFNQVLPTPAAGQAASGGTTQAFNKVLPTPGGGQAASGGTTQAFNQTLPLPAGQGANVVATPATEASTVVMKKGAAGAK